MCVCGGLAIAGAKKAAAEAPLRTIPCDRDMAGVRPECGSDAAAMLSKSQTLIGPGSGSALKAAQS